MICPETDAKEGENCIRRRAIQIASCAETLSELMKPTSPPYCTWLYCDQRIVAGNLRDILPPARLQRGRRETEDGRRSRLVIRVAGISLWRILIAFRSSSLTENWYETLDYTRRPADHTDDILRAAAAVSADDMRRDQRHAPVTASPTFFFVVCHLCRNFICNLFSCNSCNYIVTVKPCSLEVMYESIFRIFREQTSKCLSQDQDHDVHDQDEGQSLDVSGRL